MSTLDEVRKAYEGLSDDDKKTFHQTISDRVHESIAAQERAVGKEDSQTAAAREHEALGAEHADERREEESKGVSGDKKDEAQDKRIVEVREQSGNQYKELTARIDKLEESVNKLLNGYNDKLGSAAQKYGMSNREIATGGKTYTDEDVKKLLG